jgi:phenylacetate-CoA ligase
MMEAGAHGASAAPCFPGGVGNTEQQLAGHGRPAARRLRRHAELPAHPAGEGRRDRAGAALAEARHSSAARPSRRRCATGCASAACRATRPTPPPTSGLIAYETAAREGLVIDEGVIVEIVRPGTGDPGARRRGGRGGGDRSLQPATTRWCASAPATFPPCCPGAAPRGRTNRRIQRLDGARRPDRQGRAACSCTRARWPTCVRRHPELDRARGWSSKARWPTTA